MDTCEGRLMLNVCKCSIDLVSLFQFFQIKFEVALCKDAWWRCYHWLVWGFCYPYPPVGLVSVRDPVLCSRLGLQSLAVRANTLVCGQPAAQ